MRCEDESHKCILLFPTEHLPRPGVAQHCGCGPVTLPDAEHRTARCDILKNLARQHLGVFRLLTERQQENVGAPLLRNGLLMRQIAQIYQVVAQAPLADGGDDFGVRLAGEPDLQA